MWHHINFRLKWVLITACFLSTPILGRSAVTYTLSGGRLGDNLLSYCHAKWISFYYDIPLLYYPFAYSDQLMLHEQETLLTQNLINSFDALVDISKVPSYIIEPDKNILYIVPFFSESIIERSRYSYFFETGWKNETFLYYPS